MVCLLYILLAAAINIMGDFVVSQISIRVLFNNEMCHLTVSVAKFRNPMSDFKIEFNAGALFTKEFGA